MNYAQDALWWRLKNQQVRDLAMLLTAPALWHTGHELSIQTLLGDNGFRYLLALDDEPSPLMAYLQQDAPFAYRLGFYAESLLAFWFSHAPHAKLFGQNIQYQCQQSKNTLGAIDFLVALQDAIYHVELTCKYYGHQSGLVSQLVGMNPKDSLCQKADKLQQQLSLSQNEDFRRRLLVLAKLPNDTVIQPVSIVRGMYFTPSQVVAHNDSYVDFNPYAWQGEWVESLSQWQIQYPVQADERWMWLSKAQLLSAVRVEEAACKALANITWLGEPAWLVSLQKRPDGCWHEAQRYMVMGA